ncbi:MAG: hypothetical protein SGI92_12805 [Bryobacteraceae bacterium]|nr:hypothetical protein [Bryobacteraceae bacterium]
MTNAVICLPLAPLLGFAMDMLAHAVLARAFPGGAHVRIQFVSFGFGMAVVITVLAYLLWQYPFSPTDRVGYLLLHIMVYTCLGFGLFNVINANVSSLRVRMLKEYRAADPEPLSDAAMFARYPAAEILAARLTRLSAGGQIYARDDRYFPRKGGVALIARFFSILRRLLLCK